MDKVRRVLNIILSNIICYFHRIRFQNSNFKGLRILHFIFTRPLKAIIVGSYIIESEK